MAARGRCGHLPSATFVFVGVFAFCEGNGLLEDEATEPQQSLFSWAGFMAKEW